MKKWTTTIWMVLLALALAACSNASPAEERAGNANGNETPATSAAASEAGKPTTVEITDAYGTVAVPINPKNVVSLDNRTFETLAEWGVPLAAAPKAVMPSDSVYVADEAVLDIGNHREPNLEVIAAVNPELVIVGQRFVGYYEDIKKLVPNAAVLHIDIDVSAEDGTAGDHLVNGFKETTTMLGTIFDKAEEAQALNARFDQALEAAKAAYNGTDTVMSVIVSGGNIGYAAPHHGRVWGPLYDIFGWKPALELESGTTDHQGDEISVEAIAQSNPDWLLVMDRDAALPGTEEKVPAQDVIDRSPALQNTTAVSKGQIVYAPADTYTNESIQTFIEIFENLAESLKK